MEGILLFTFIALAYFIPSVIASSRNHISGGGIFVLNLVLGWTFLGWVIALVWSCSGENRKHLKGKNKVTVLSKERLKEIELEEIARAEARKKAESIVNN